MIRINGWKSKFEVNKKGREYRDGDIIRLGAFEWVRWPVQGQNWDLRYRHLLKEAGPKAAAATYAVYVKLVELSAAQAHDRRGRVYCGDLPADAESIAEMTGFDQGQVEKALAVLSAEKVGLITVTKETTDEPEGESIPQESEESPEVPEARVFCKIPVTGKSREFVVRTDWLEPLIISYPTIDVLGEIKKAARWCLSNKGKRKTERGINSFIGRWLESAVNSNASHDVTPELNRSERTLLYKRLFPEKDGDWIRYAAFTGVEYDEWKKGERDKKEQGQKQRETTARKRTNSGGPQSAGSVISKIGIQLEGEGNA